MASTITPSASVVTITPPATDITPVPAKHARRRIAFIRERLRDLSAEKKRLDAELQMLKEQVGLKVK